MKHFRLVISALLVTTALFFNIAALAESADALLIDSPNIIADIGMPVAGISNPFDYIEEDAWGWCVAEGVLSDLAVDLDCDGGAERLVVYFAPSESAVQDEMWDPKYEHPLGRKDLRLAVFGQQDGVFVKQSDIIIEEFLAYPYINIRVSVWGDELKRIYVHSATLNEGAMVRHYALAYRNDGLKVDLALISAQFSDYQGLYRLSTDDPSTLYTLDYTNGNEVNESARDLLVNDIAVENRNGFGPYIDSRSTKVDGFASAEKCELEHHDDLYAKMLAKQLQPFGIDDKRDEDSTACMPVCAIRFYVGRFLHYWDWDINTPGDFTNGSQMIDYTGVAR